MCYAYRVRLTPRADRSEPTVSSRQRYPRGAVATARELADLYFSWLARAWGPLVRVDDARPARLAIRLLGARAIDLQAADGDADARFRVQGGLLARPGGEFCFEVDGDDARISLTGFRPRLPLWLYRWSHGPAHTWTMARFGRFLRRRGPRS
jgi:hypothetical protein